MRLFADIEKEKEKAKTSLASESSLDKTQRTKNKNSPRDEANGLVGVHRLLMVFRQVNVRSMLDVAIDW
jgi:hypothetical protein